MLSGITIDAGSSMILYGRPSFLLTVRWASPKKELSTEEQEEIDAAVGSFDILRGARHAHKCPSPRRNALP